MQFAQRQQQLQPRWSSIAAVLLVGLLLGFAGPFGTNPGYSAATRYAFWMSMTVVGAVLAFATNRAISTTSIRGWAARIGIITLISALPMTFIVAWTMSLIQSGRTFSLFQLAALFSAVAVVQLLIVAATNLAARPIEADQQSSTSTGDSDEALPTFPQALIAKIPADVGHSIVALESDDHYLRVHAAHRSTLILMRMADAVSMLDPRLGAQVHRRWWVNEAKVVGLRTERQRLILRMSNGLDVPVGRTFAATARARFSRTTSS